MRSLVAQSLGRCAACHLLVARTACWASTRLALVPHPTSRALAQCGDGTARSASRPPRGRRTWLCRYGRRRLVSGEPAAFGSPPRRTEPQRKHTGTARPRRPWPVDGDGRRDIRFSGAGREPFPFRTGCFLFLQVPCGTVAPCVQPVTGSRGRGHELANERRGRGSRGLDSAAGKEQSSARRRFLQVTKQKNSQVAGPRLGYLFMAGGQLGARGRRRR